ncbi:MAG: hypothetical protein IJV24_04435 [Prevotella sp.]|nr:hypothetical protein [Prevotella sp.]
MDILLAALEQLTHSKEGLLYIAMMALSLIPLCTGIWRIFKGISFWSVFFLCFGFFHCLWFCLSLIVIYQSTPPGTPHLIYPILAFLWVVVLAYLMIITTRKHSARPNSRLTVILKAVGAIVASVVCACALFILLIVVGLFSVSYDIKTGGKAWLTESEIRKCVGTQILPAFHYIEEKSTTGGNHEVTMQDHWGVFDKKTSASFWRKINRKCDTMNSNWNLSNSQDGKRFYYNNAVRHDGHDYCFFIYLTQDCDTFNVVIQY